MMGATAFPRWMVWALAAALAGAGGVAQARGGDCGPGVAGHGMGPGQHGPWASGEGPRAAMRERMRARQAQRLAELKAKLALAPQQEAAWARFAQAVQLPERPPARPDPAELAQLSTPQRIERMQALKAERDAQRSQRWEATKALYAVLTPEQQKVFDAEAARRLPHGGGRHGAPSGPGRGAQPGFSELYGG